jgi:UDP-N-acetylmuramate--alanine ligase
VKKEMIQKDDVLNFVKNHSFEVLIVLGAGDLDNQVPEIAKLLNNK